eukprot:TRINITY_DN2489_c0_g2_i1.p1 TRINITY_DN2489_c0_g2~~TRINITY_DN2489_c0_g2_i1.p1  ORF type:complete len:303 (-),score=21.70 TRINITY_DN2489_c0_g2_i1:202-1110(-)
MFSQCAPIIRLPQKVPYEEELDWNARFQRVCNSTDKAIAEYSKDSYLEVFRKFQFSLFVYDSNRMEGTISPAHKEGPTVAMIVKFLDGSDVPEEVSWDSEGGRDANATSSRYQLYTYTRAVRHLLQDNVNKDLSHDLILETYQMMMHRATIDGKEFAKSFRTNGVEVSAGQHCFVPGAAVGGAIDKLVAEYNERRERKENPVGLATFLFYELVSIHPALNGNGRLSRLFLTWSLMKSGLPFPLSFSTGHKGRRRHYLHAIQSARRPEGHRGELNVILIISLERTIGNFITNVKLIRGEPITE